MKQDVVERVAGNGGEIDCWAMKSMRKKTKRSEKGKTGGWRSWHLLTQSYIIYIPSLLGNSSRIKIHVIN